MMEAMSHGVPVVATPTSGVPELVEHEVSGLLVNPQDAEAIAAAVVRLAQDSSLRERLVEGGREKVEAEFEIGANAAKLLRLFEGASGSEAQLNAGADATPEPGALG